MIVAALKNEKEKHEIVLNIITFRIKKSKS